MVANVKAFYWEGTGPAGHAVRDISASGAFILADFKWMPGTILTTTLKFDTSVGGSGSLMSLSVSARVVRQGPAGVGVQFLCPDKGERKRVADFVQKIQDAQSS